MHATVVIPTYNACALLLEALTSLHDQSRAADAIVVVDNASTDGTTAAVRERFPAVTVIGMRTNVGFGRAINAGVHEIPGNTDAIVLVNNDTVCEHDFLDALLAPLDDPDVGMVAGVLLQGSAPYLVDSAGIELDSTLRSWDMGWNEDYASVAGRPEPIGPCGGAAAFRSSAFRDAGGFDETFFAYWEDVDLALRLRLAGWRCVRATGARALHRHGATLGAASPSQRRLEAFGRAYVLAKYRVARRSLLTRAQIALLDWPVLVVHLLVRREAAPLRARWRGTRAGLAHAPLRAPLELATVSVATALRRQFALLGLRAKGGMPEHFRDNSPVAEAPPDG